MILDKGVSARMTWKTRGALAAVGLTILAVSPWVVAEEPPPQPKVPLAKNIGASDAFSFYYGDADGKQKSKTAKKTIYRVQCRLLNEDRLRNENDNIAFAPQIVLAEGEAGEISIGRETPLALSEDLPAEVENIMIGYRIKQVTIRKLDGEFVLVRAEIEDIPTMAEGRFPDDDGLVVREFQYVYTKHIRVFEKAQLGKTFSVPLADVAGWLFEKRGPNANANDSATRRLEFTVTRLEPAKPQSPDEAVLTFPAPVADPVPPTAQEVRTLLIERLKANKDVPTFMESTAIKDLRVIVELIVDAKGPEKFYPLVGPARLHQRKYMCTAFFKVERQANWPVSFKSAGNGEEVFYIDRDQLIRTSGPTSGKPAPDKSTGEETSSTDTGTKPPAPKVLKGQGVTSDAGLVGEVIVDERAERE